VVVVARRVEELVVWQLGNELRQKVHATTAIGPAARDGRFRDQIRDAASSVTRNVAEGFGRYGHREFAQFLNIARGSLFEIEDHLRDGVARGYWDAKTTKELHDLCNRTIAATTYFIRYLNPHPSPLEPTHLRTQAPKHRQSS
jgi:four helix bundle protein